MTILSDVAEWFFPTGRRTMLSAEHNRILTIIRDLQEELADLKDDLQRWRDWHADAVTSAAKYRADNAALNEQVERLSSTMSDMRSARDTYRDQRNDAIKAVAELRRGVNGLLDTTAKSDAAIRDRDRDIDFKDRQISELRAEIATRKREHIAECDDLRGQLEALRKPPRGARGRFVR